MLIDEPKMAVDSSFSFLNRRNQHTNLDLSTSISDLRLKHRPTFTGQNRSTKTSHNRIIQIVNNTSYASQPQIPIRLHCLTKLMSKLNPVLKYLNNGNKITRLFILRQRLSKSNTSEKSSIRHNRKPIRAYDDKLQHDYEVTNFKGGLHLK